MVYLASFFVALGVMSAAYLIGLRRHRFDIVDVFWGVTIATVGVMNLVWQDERSWLHFILVGMISLWAFRLSSHILRRWSRSTAEDPRYVQLRKSWPKDDMEVQIFQKIYVVQALLATIVSLPVIVFVSSPTPAVSMLFIIGVALWVLGFIIESVADAQLARFVAEDKNRDKIMDRGLWAYSRHPNYLGEILMWWGVSVLALSVEYGWIGLVGAGLITYLIIFVSGLPPAEKRMSQKKGWQEYAAKTPALFPGISTSKG